MSLISALNIGSSALAVSQAQIQTTGNNIANAGNGNYTRETSTVTENDSQQISSGVYLGTGVDLTGIQRQVDEALNARVNSSISDNQAATTTGQWLGQVQSAFNALSGSDLSSQLNTFYNDWSTLANNPADPASGRSCSRTGGRRQYVSITAKPARQHSGRRAEQPPVASHLRQPACVADRLAQRSRSSLRRADRRGGDNSLLDQRDAAVSSLSQLMDVTTCSSPADRWTSTWGPSRWSRLTKLRRRRAEPGRQRPAVVATAAFQSNGETMDITSGQIGALNRCRGRSEPCRASSTRWRATSIFVGQQGALERAGIDGIHIGHVHQCGHRPDSAAQQHRRGTDLYADQRQLCGARDRSDNRPANQHAGAGESHRQHDAIRR